MSAVDHVLWIGGPPGSGKTTVARRLARKHGLRLYSTDTRTWDHRDRALASNYEPAMRWEAMTPAERRSGDPAEMLRMSLHHERRQMVIDDLEAMPTAPLIVAEGTCVPASASAARPHRAVWLLPSEEFQQSSLAMRSLDRGSLEMYMLLSQQIVDEARAHRLPTVRVDRTHPLDAVMEAVEDAFSAALTNGPRILVMTDRRILLREINQAVVAQVRGYYARPWAAGDADSVIQSFVCECGEAACTAEVSTTVGAAAAQPIVAHPFDERLRHHEA